MHVSFSSLFLLQEELQCLDGQHDVVREKIIIHIPDDIQERELHQLQLMQENAKESCMTSFRLLHSFLQVLSYDESKSMRVSERAFMTLFGQDNETFTSTMSLNLDQLQRQLDKDEFQEDKSHAAFGCCSTNQFQMLSVWLNILGL
ncbi:hypothetical protein Tco_0405544 [Tanacetum coccineum]